MYIIRKTSATNQFFIVKSEKSRTTSIKEEGEFQHLHVQSISNKERPSRTRYSMTQSNAAETSPKIRT